MTKTAPAIHPKKGLPLLRRCLKLLGWLCLVVLLIILVLGYFIWNRLNGSLPLLDGEATLAGITQPVSVTRDDLGVPTITAANQLDMARTIGFIHAQDRFFQMDGLRRLPAGELSAIFGKGLVSLDQSMRRHQLRDIARKIYRNAPAQHRQIFEAYTDGVNQGLEQMKARPVEYLLLKTKPEPWYPEDSVLVIFAMTIDLQGSSGNYERALGTMQATLPETLFDFLTPWGSEWDAPLRGPALSPMPIPGPEVIDLRGNKKAAKLAIPTRENDFKPGSNNWAVAGQLTPYQSGMIANDMHLSLGMPHIWYRARLIWTDVNDHQWDLIGVTLPGTPTIVVGSNGYIAWGFTNSYLDWSDIIVLEDVPNQPNYYQTPDGPQAIEKITVTIDIKDREPHIHQYERTQWGPVIAHDHLNRRLVMKWSIHYPAATNFNLLALNQAKTVRTAMSIAQRCGIPGQNIVIADKNGHIGWTIAGIIPKRVGFDGRTPTSWADGSRYWDGWLEPEAYPQVFDPPLARIWTANARVVEESHLPIVGESGYAIGARAKQIRDRLHEKDQFNEEDMLAIQLDDEAIFLTRWQQLLLSQLSSSSVSEWQMLQKLVENWGGRASVDSAGYRLVRHYRSIITSKILAELTAATLAKDADFDYTHIPQQEGIIWKILQEKPAHLVPVGDKDWADFLENRVDDLIEQAKDLSGGLENHTWGRRNTLKMTHPFSNNLSMFANRLNMKPEPLAGDRHMPRVQSPDFGASERMIIAPGHEDQALFHMPGGQCAHPLSPFYRAGHDAWVEGRPTPLLPGPTRHQLLFRPQNP